MWFMKEAHNWVSRADGNRKQRCSHSLTAKRVSALKTAGVWGPDPRRDDDA